VVNTVLFRKYSQESGRGHPQRQTSALLTHQPAFQMLLQKIFIKNFLFIKRFIFGKTLEISQIFVPLLVNK